MGTLLRQLERVLGSGELEAQLPKLALPPEAPVLRRLDLGAPRLELVLCRLGQLSRLDQLPLEGLGLACRLAMRIPRFAPFLPHDAASQELQTRQRFRTFASGRGLGADHIEPWLDLGLEILEPQ